MEKKRKKRLKLNMLGQMLILMAVMLMMVMVSAAELEKAGHTLEEMETIWADLRLCETESRNLKEASDYLTDAIRSFVLSSDLEAMDHYWKEVNTDKRREQAVSRLQEMDLTETEECLVQDAKEESDHLMLLEIHAMKLIAGNLGLTEEEQSQKVREETLSDSEMALTEDGKGKAALEAVFGKAYMEQKNNINENLNEFSGMLVERKRAEVEAVHEKMRGILRTEHALNLFFCVLFLINIFLYYRRVVMPFGKYNEGIQHIADGEEDTLPLTGSGEMRRFGENFNRVYGDWRGQNRKLEELSKIDFLTKLPNRAALEERMEAICANQPSSFALLKVDVDSLRRFNDEYGHLTGDHILVLVAKAISSAIGQQGMAVRLSGEEFLAVFENLNAGEVQMFSSDILEQIRQIDCQKVGIPNHCMYVTASIGCTLWEKTTGERLSLNTLLYQAELALMFSKKNGKNRSTMYQKDSSFQRLADEVKESRAVVEDMYRALERHEFIPYYQPQYDFHTQEMIGAEALVRWKHPDKGVLAPGVFIPEFEKNGLVKELDLEMLRQVCSSLRRWMDEGRKPPCICCNFSRRHFDGEGNVAEQIAGIAEEYGVPASLLTIEITESALDEDAGNLKAELHKIRELGFQIALDDFGVGYSSLGILTEFPISLLKIDKSFLDRDLRDKKNFELLKGVLNIAKALDLKTISEGVETKEQAELLRDMGCMYAQGYYYSRPIPSENFESMM